MEQRSVNSFDEDHDNFHEVVFDWAGLDEDEVDQYQSSIGILHEFTPDAEDGPCLLPDHHLHEAHDADADGSTDKFSNDLTEAIVGPQDAQPDITPDIFPFASFHTNLTKLS